MDTKKIAATFAILVIALGIAGYAYASWSSYLYIDGTVNTGYIGAIWTVGTGYDSEIAGKDYSSISGYISGDTLYVTVTNGYPCIDYWLPVDILNTGSIPIHIWNIEPDFSGLPVGTVIELIADPAHAADPVLAVGVQIHPGFEAYGLIHIHLPQETVQHSTYHFSVTVTYGQWNLSPD